MLTAAFLKDANTVK